MQSGLVSIQLYSAYYKYGSTILATTHPTLIRGVSCLTYQKLKSLSRPFICSNSGHSLSDIISGITFCSGYSIKNLLNKPPLSSNKTRDDKLFKMPRSISYKQAGSMSGFLCHNIRRYFLLGGVLVWHVFEHLNMVLPWSTLESSLIKLRRGLLEGKSKKWVEVIASDMALHGFTKFVSFWEYVELNNIRKRSRLTCL